MNATKRYEAKRIKSRQDVLKLQKMLEHGNIDYINHHFLYTFVDSHVSNLYLILFQANLPSL